MTMDEAKMSRGRILLVEDEPGLLLSLSDRLESEGYEVTTAEDGERGFDLALTGSFDAMVFDVMLPKKNGFDLCRDLRGKGVGTPILLLTARGEVMDRVLGLKLGADDYLTKPFDMMELTARVEALLRRSGRSTSAESGVYSFGDVTVDLRSAEARRDGEGLGLSALDYKLLVYFIEHRGELLDRDRLLDEVWGYDATPVTRTVDVHVARLRQKIEPNPSHPRYLLTVHGMGYKFVG